MKDETIHYIYFNQFWSFNHNNFNDSTPIKSNVVELYNRQRRISFNVNILNTKDDSNRNIQQI